MLFCFSAAKYITVQVKGEGIASDVFRGIVHAFEQTTQNSTIDKLACLPIPQVPNYKLYYMILLLSFLAWLSTFCEPYALRLRHVIMRLYYPSVARKRAVWLYNKILINRCK